MSSTCKIRDTATLYLSIDKIVDLGGISFALVREFYEDDKNGEVNVFYELVESISDVVPNPDYEECDQARFDTAKPYELSDGEHLIECVRFHDIKELPDTRPHWTLIRSTEDSDHIAHVVNQQTPVYYAFNTLGL